MIPLPKIGTTGARRHGIKDSRLSLRDFWDVFDFLDGFDVCSVSRWAWAWLTDYWMRDRVRQPLDIPYGVSSTVQCIPTQH